MEIRFLTVSEVLQIHAAEIRLYGGPMTTLSTSGLESAGHAPQDSNYYGRVEDVFSLAAVYVYHISKAHAFEDGNKRTGFGAAVAFLDANGYPWPDNPPNMAWVVKHLVEDRINIAQMEDCLRLVYEFK